MVALDANTGAIKWQTYMTTPGHAGTAIWGGQPTLDLKRNSIYVGTGNNYTIDDELLTADSPDNHVDAIVALDMDTGSIKWSTKLTPNGQPDIWTFLCFVVPSPSCGPDYDFGQSPMLLTAKINGKNTDIIVNGQKSGLFFGLNPDNGQLIWTTPVGPGSALGGMEFGSATDGKYIYATITNFYNIPYHLINPAPGSLAATTGGLWTALDPANGNIVWQSADPDLNIIPAGVTVANGVLYGGSLSQDGTKSGAFTALDRDTGKILWRYNTLIDANNTGAIFGSPAIVKGKVYWGAGYPRIFPNGSSNQFFAFSINGK
jgi:polyvinyl alcohol dehydrogenase (cytochrome)